MNNESVRCVGECGNYYGGLYVKESGGKFYWGIEDYDGIEFSEIPEGLFIALNDYWDNVENDH